MEKPAPKITIETMLVTGMTQAEAAEHFGRLSIGRRWGGKPITMICVDNHVDIKITATGEHIAAYTMNDDKIYYNQKDNCLGSRHI